jgi:uncharacterized membrane protein
MAKKSSINIDENIAGALCYVLVWITGLIFLLIEPNNKFIRFHAMQSILVFLPLMILQAIFMFIPFIGWIIGWLIGLLTFVLWIVLMYKAYNKEKWKVPIVGDIAENQIK